MANGDLAGQRFASVEERVEAIQSALDERGFKATQAVDELDHLAQEEWIPRNGARVVAKAWSDSTFRKRLLADGRCAVTDLGFPMPKHHRHLVVLENTPSVHNVICCSQCSCTAFTLIGLPPDWYKDLEYRARIVRQSRSVLKEMGLDLPLDIEIRVWDTTADTRYMVLPEQPHETIGWSEDRLADIITRDELERRAGGRVPLAAPSTPGRTNVATRERFKTGDRVRVRNDYVPGHVRLPGYIRGRTGTVISESPAYPFPDAHAHALESQDEPTYDVRFRSEDLWPNSSDTALIHVGVFQSYLERAA